MITIHQIRLTNSEIVRVNAGEDLPKYRAKMNTMISAKKFQDTDFAYYTPTFEVATDDLEEAFELTNLWEAPDLVKTIVRGHSSSVGDIFQHADQYFIVDSFGFKEIFPVNNKVVA
jgi:hypothetical protein